MGRHSVPDPEETSDEQPHDAGTPEIPDVPSPYGGFDEPRSDHRGYADPEEPSSDLYAAEDADVTDAFREPLAGYDEPEAATRSFAVGGPPARPPSSPKAQHDGDWEGGEWTGSHRAIQPGRRGISTGVIAALVTVVVVVGAFILWRFVGDSLSNRSSVAAARCVAGEVAVAVVADPTIADDIRGLADEYNATASPVGDKCVKIGVTASNATPVIDGFAGDWPGDLGERPALWVPGSSISVARLEAVPGPDRVSVTRSLVTSPVMLAVRPELKTALGQRNWAALPELQSSPTALDGLQLPGWGALRLALPLADDGDATFAAAEAVAAASVPAGAPATAGAGAVSTLLTGQPELGDDASGTALDALLRDGSPAAAPVHAVVSTEQQIFRRSASTSEAKESLAAWMPTGPSALADYPAVQLSGSWLTKEQVTAASEFDKYLRRPESLTAFAEVGFRVDGANPPASDVVPFGAVSDPVRIGDDGDRVTLANAVGTPLQSQTVTILLDQSMNNAEAGGSRVANVAAALNDRLGQIPRGSSIGLWTFDGVAGRPEVATGPLGDPVDGRPRAQVLTDNLNGQVASDGGRVSFTTLRLLYTEAVANFREGQENSVLVITTGPHTDQSLDGPGLQAFVSQTFTPGRPVAVNVIDFGADPDRSTWEAVAQSTGGSYQNVPSSAGPELGAAIATTLG